MTADRVSGLVLAGGRSTRFGRDKLAEPVEGGSLLDAAIRPLDPLCTDLIVVIGANAPEPVLADTIATLRVIRDERPDGGPLVGLATGLEAAPNPVVLVVAGDMPSLATDVLRLLAETVGGGAAAAALEEAGVLRPLPCAVDRAAALAASRSVEASGGSSLLRVLESLAAAGVPEETWRRLDPDGSSLRDVDRPEDLPPSERGDG